MPLAEERRRFRHLLAETVAIEDSTQRQLDSLGPMSRPLHRDAVTTSSSSSKT